METAPKGDGPDQDEDLIARYAAGDPRAAALLTARLAPRALAQARRMLGDRAEAEDVTQEAMLRLWRAAPGWTAGQARVSTWMFRVVANLCIDRIRRARRQAVPVPGQVLDDLPDAGATSADGALIDRTRMSALRQALADLPDRQREAVVLRHLEGWSNPRIAETMDLGVEAVESLTARGKRALAAALAARRDELGYHDD